MSAPPVPPREDYHHGNLADAALKEGLRALACGEELSMRAIARAIGVAHRALFNHFPDRASFEAALSAEGFTRLSAVLRTTKSPAAFVRAYVDFALTQSALYDLMMRQPYGMFESHPGLRIAADDVIAVSLAGLAPRAVDTESGRRAVMRIWMIAHGGVGLHRSGVLRMRSDAAFAKELLRIAGFGDTAPDGEQMLQSNRKEKPS